MSRSILRSVAFSRERLGFVCSRVSSGFFKSRHDSRPLARAVFGTFAMTCRRLTEIITQFASFGKSARCTSRVTSCIFVVICVACEAQGDEDTDLFLRSRGKDADDMQILSSSLACTYLYFSSLYSLVIFGGPSRL